VTRREGRPDDAQAPTLLALAKFFRGAIKSGEAGYLVARVHARDAGLLTDASSEEPPHYSDLGKSALKLAGKRP
jgi:hypothetical protein